MLRQPRYNVGPVASSCSLCIPSGVCDAVHGVLVLVPDEENISNRASGNVVAVRVARNAIVGARCGRPQRSSIVGSVFDDDGSLLHVINNIKSFECAAFRCAHAARSGSAVPASMMRVRGLVAGVREDRNLVDPASSHTLVLKIKPCMSKYKQPILRNCEWLIISVIVYLIVPYYLDNRSNSRANTCVKSRLLRRKGCIY